jgi:glycosyltransferase involved in cell wall biosynthesis
MVNQIRSLHNARLIFPVGADNTPSGGRKFIYHVVDFLNEAGFDAWVAHPWNDFRLTWFKNTTRVGYTPELFPKQRVKGLKSALRYWNWKRSGCVNAPLGNSQQRPTLLSLRGSDIIVVPETRLPVLQEMPSQCHKIIFNQNPYMTFARNFSGIRPPLQNFFGTDVLGMLVVSKLNYDVQKFMFPNIRIVEAKLLIEEEFSYREMKTPQIAYMPRRRERDALTVLNMLRFRGEDIRTVSIDGMSQQEVTEALGESLIFLSFADREGFGLPAAEAMACGCIVIGYSGNGGDEFFDPSYCFPIQEGDLCGFVNAIEATLLQYRQESESLNRMRILASQVIRERYSRERSKHSIVSAFQTLLEDV